MATGVRHS
jgi:NADH:ubiquinone reductase (H+-translocating)